MVYDKISKTLNMSLEQIRTVDFKAIEPDFKENK